MNRRTFTKVSTTAFLANAIHPLANGNARDTPAPAKNAASGEVAQAHDDAMKQSENFWGGKKVKIAFLVYPGMFLQDLVGPMTVFEALMNREIYLVWKDKNTFTGRFLGPKPLIPVTPNLTFNECPDDLDVLCVPGGVPGTFEIMEDDAVLAFLRTKGAKAQYVTSVCTGSMVLAAAGLLKGYRATSHWLTRDALKEMGAIPTTGRIVTDRNRITGGGVTAGIDFGLAIAAKLRSDAYAQAIQLYIEYDPQPPFDSGSPEKAPKQIKALVENMFSSLREKAKTSAEKAARKM